MSTVWLPKWLVWPHSHVVEHSLIYRKDTVDIVRPYHDSKSPTFVLIQITERVVEKSRLHITLKNLEMMSTKPCQNAMQLIL